MNFRSLSFHVLLAVVLGIFVGFFFGPYCKVIEPVGEVYVMLLQMVALPYICFTLIHGLGSMTPEIAKKLFKRGWVFWVGLWALIFAVIYLSSLLIPKSLALVTGKVHTLETESSLASNFLSYLVPENPFYDLANNIVPAIAVFGLIVGVALMHLEKKEPLLSILERANQVIEKILKWIAILSPIGIFAHLAVATGTVYFGDLLSIQFYVIAFIGISLLMVFWVLPILLSSLTPLSYSEVLKAFKIVCLLPFVTGLPTIALPFIILYMKSLGKQHAEGDPNFHATSQTVMPFCYSFGQIGNCLILFYIFFLSFYYRHPFAGAEKGLLSLLTIPLSIGSSASSISAVSFLIKQLDFPNEAIQLFTETMAVTLNFQVLLSVASILTFIILVLYSYYGLLQINWKKLTANLLGVFGLVGLFVLVGKTAIRPSDNYQNLYFNLSIAEVISDPVKAKMVPSGKPRNSSSEPLLEILRTGVLKVGYDPVTIPYCYWSHNHELIGYDIAFAYQLARDLDCTLEFVPVELNRMGEQLLQGEYDIVMAAILMTEERIKTMDFTKPYTEQDNVLIVPQRRYSKYLNLKRVQAQKGMRFGAIGGYIPVIGRHFPLGVHVLGSDPLQEFQKGQIDAWVSSRTPGFVWCLSNPGYIAIDYGEFIGKQYFAYPIRNYAVEWTLFLNNWLALKEQSGFKERMISYWIEGENPLERPPRWSIIRNVLNWVD